jgi:hypothetical protein
VRRPRAAWQVVDVVLVLVFASVGRRSHTEGVTVAGVLHTAWPFLLGTGAGWALAGGWRRPLTLWPTGVVTWLSTVVVGMVLRRLVGEGTAVDFVLVATAFLGLFLLGWRAITSTVLRRRTGRRSLR